MRELFTRSGASLVIELTRCLIENKIFWGLSAGSRVASHFFPTLVRVERKRGGRVSPDRILQPLLTTPYVRRYVKQT